MWLGRTDAEGDRFSMLEGEKPARVLANIEATRLEKTGNCSGSAVRVY